MYIYVSTVDEILLVENCNSRISTFLGEKFCGEGT